MLARLPVSSAGSRLVHCHRHIRRPIVRIVAFHATRTYATPGRPKSVVGEPSKPVKRATSRATGTSTTSAKRTTTKTAKSTKAAAKKPRAKKAAPKKAATKKKPKKVTLTEEQKAAQKAKLLKRKTSEKKKADLLEIKTLKEQALAPPVPVTGNRNAYNVYVAEAMKGAKGSNGDVTSAFAHVAKQYKSLSAAEKETYQERAAELEAMRLVAIKKWIKSHSAAEIGLANKARARLNRLYPTGKGSRAKYPAIPDERLPKRPLSAWTIYYGEHAASRSSGSVKERINTVLSDFKQLTSAERSVYDRKARDSRHEFERVYQEVYGKAPAAPEANAA